MAKNKVSLEVDATQHVLESKKPHGKLKRIYSRELNLFLSGGYSLNKVFTSDSGEKCDACVISFLKDLRSQIDEELDYLEKYGKI